MVDRRAVGTVGLLALLLAVVALAGGARRGSSAGSVHPLGLRVVGDVVAIAAALIALVGVAGWAGVLWARRRRTDGDQAVLPPRLPPFWDRLLRILLPFALVALALGVVIGGRLTGWWDRNGPDPERGPADSTGRGLSPRTDVGIDWPLVVLVVALVVMIVAGLALMERRQRRRGARRQPGTTGSSSDELDALRTAGLEELEREPDPRRAVIRAYAAMCRLLASSGLPRRPSETPFEFLARVLQELGASAAAAHRLTELFERAEFSVHPISEAFKGEAIDAVRGLQAEVTTRPRDLADVVAP